MDAKNISRIALGAMMISAGIGHLTFGRKAFRKQVPNWVPLKKDDTVVYSGYVEIALGAATIAAPPKYRKTMGNVLSAFFTAVVSGNYSQYKHHRDSFGLDTDGKRLARLFMQPLLVLWAQKSTR